MISKWAVVAAVMGMMAVAAGAFGAHALKSRLDTSALATFEVGVRYQMYHALALLGVCWMISLRPSGILTAAGICMVLGVVLFSGSIYGLVLFKWRWLGPITPLGGVCLMVGWLLMAIGALRTSAAQSLTSS